MIELKGVSKRYKNGTHALYDVNLKVNEGEFVFVMGPTGSGKSTLVKLLDGEEVPTGGKVTVAGIDVGRLRKSKVYLYRRKIGVVFQDYRLLPEKTVFENVAYALEVLDMPSDKIRKRVRDVLKLVDLSDKSNSKPKELSGGQQQRVAIARAVAKRPMIIIADEPTGNLDPNMTDEMITLLERINREEKTTILVVTHELTTVEKHPKRTIRIENGHIVSDSIYKPKPKKKPVVVEEAVEEVGADGMLFKGVNTDDEDVEEVKTPLEEKILADTNELQHLENEAAEVKQEPVKQEPVKVVEEKPLTQVVETKKEEAADLNDFTEEIPVKQVKTEEVKPVVEPVQTVETKKEEASDLNDFTEELAVKDVKAQEVKPIVEENKEVKPEVQANTNKVEKKVVYDDNEEYIIEDYTGSTSVIDDAQASALNVIDEAVQEIANTMELFNINKENDSMENK